MFYGRNYELDLLDGLLSKRTSSLVTCKGRRRIGKSSLIQKFAEEFETFYSFQGLAPRDGISNSSQLENYSEQLSHQLDLPKLKLENWTQAFSLLANNCKDKKVLILLDEISWMASKDKDFVGKLKIAWDTKFKNNPNLIMVLCGSVSSWIENNILNDSDFMGRISLEIDLAELPIDVCSKFWQPLSGCPGGQHSELVSDFEKIKILSVTGGIPRYLEEIHVGQSAEDNIKRLCFTKEGILFTEFGKIFNDIFDKRALLYKEIVTTLVNGPCSHAQICDKLGKHQSGTISKHITELATAGFISRDYVWKYDGNKTSLSRYRLKDNYLRFYLKYIDPNREKILSNFYKNVSLENLPNWFAILGYQFENLVLHNINIICGVLDIDPNSILSAAPYFQKKTSKNKGACQIDLLINTKFHTLYLCEMKFRKNIKSDIISQISNKIDLLVRPKYYSVRPVLIYEGELEERIQETEFFFRKIRFGDFLH